MEYTDEPDTLEYTADSLDGGIIWSVGMRIGFRVAPRVSVFLRQVIEDLEAEGRVDICSTYPSLKKYGVPGDFKFKIIHRIFSPSSSCGGKARFVMQIYERLRHIALSDETALGLDTSVVSVETVPLIIDNGQQCRISRYEEEEYTSDTR